MYVDVRLPCWAHNGMVAFVARNHRQTDTSVTGTGTVL